MSPSASVPRGATRGIVARLGAFVIACALPLAARAADAIAPPAAAALPARTVLDDYLEREDPSYSWSVAGSETIDGATVWFVDMRSQTWLSSDLVDRTQWAHWLTVTVPDDVASDCAMVLIGGGSNGGKPKISGYVAELAKSSRAVTAELRTVPNQPLTFDSDGHPRKEDDLIARAWVRFIETGDSMWLPRLPMVKSAVRAMDTIQALLRDPARGGHGIERFFIAGGSKRGWTTWLTGLDRRVAAIAPIVIDVLNVQQSMDHHFAAYGFWAPAIGDYVHHGLVESKFEPRYVELLRIVDPYNYRHRLRIPKFIINASGDQFFLPDSSRFYFDELEGEKHLRYVPNADHSLDGSDAIATLQACFQSIAHRTPRPEFAWTRDGSTVTVTAKTAPTEVRLWQATNAEARDFRVESFGRQWTSQPVAASTNGTWKVQLTAPEKGFRASFVELTFPGPGENPFKFTTPVWVSPDELPHQADLEALDARLRARPAKEG